jgi:hydrogenase assembly chaperone HypC/HupF
MEGRRGRRVTQELSHEFRSVLPDAPVEVTDRVRRRAGPPAPCVTGGPHQTGLAVGGLEHEASICQPEVLTMCVGFPGRVVAVDELGATVDQEGRTRRASTFLMPDLAMGDWVLVAAGTVVERLDPAQAELIQATLREAIASQDAKGSAPARNGGTA